MNQGGKSVETTAMVHIAIESWGIVNCLIACLCIFLEKDATKEEKTNILKMEVCDIFLMLSDCLAWGFDGRSGNFSYWILQISNTSVFICNYTYMIIFSKYMWQLICKDERKPIKRIRFIHVMCTIAIILMLLSRIGNFFFYFDTHNFYHRGRGYLITQVIPVIGLGIGISILYQYRSCLRKNVLIAMSSYFVLPFIATVIIIFYYGISLQAIAVVVSTEIVFIVEEINMRHSLAEAKVALENEQILLEEKQTQLEEAVLEAEKANLAKTEFLSRMSHDIRTPINGILGMINIADKNVEDMEKQKEVRQKIRTSANHLLSLVNDVLDISKLESGKVELIEEPFNLKETIDNCTDIIKINADQLGVNATFNNEIEDGEWLGSALYIGRVILNIAGNAIKYNKVHGSVTCTARIEGLIGKDLMQVYFCIQDTGIGMSQEFLKKVYEPFSQAQPGARSKYEGTGLGMAITKRLVEQMNGTISIESEVSVGTKVEVMLPLKVISINQKDANEANEDERLKEQEDFNGQENFDGMKVLLVDDNEINLEVSKFILEEAGAVVTIAMDGKEAVGLFEQSPAGTYDIILMDIMMPIMDGYEATRTIRNLSHPQARTIPIIAVTANAFGEDVQKAKESGMNAHIAKPIDSKKMLQVMKKYTKKI